MIKMAAFSCRPDELGFFRQFGKAYGVETVTTERPPDLGNAGLAEGCEAVCVLTTPVGRELIDRWHEMGVGLISTRTVGFEHIDCRYAASLGIRVTNAAYTPYTVAEYTVMAMLMALRRMKVILNRYLGQDFSLDGIRGRQLRGMTVGVVGTGRIGERVIEMLGGFGCRILAYDLQEKESIRGKAVYAGLEDIWRECDLITFHTPATSKTFHMVNRETIDRMKKGVVLVNMARGSLIDTQALIEGLETGKIGAAALDVVENEGGIYYKDFKYQPLKNRDMAVLGAMPNVLMTPHTAFFTDEAVSDMVECSMMSCVRFMSGEADPLWVNGQGA